MKNEIATGINSYPLHEMFLKIHFFLKRAAKKNREASCSSYLCEGVTTWRRQ